MAQANARQTTTLEADRRRLLALIAEKGFRRGVFRLSSGRLSPYYIDLRKIGLEAEGAYLCGRLLFDLVRDSGAQAVGGLTLGADPLVTAAAVASYEAGQPINAFIVRKEAKGHGTGRWIEGPDITPGMPVAIIDDVITTGGSALQAAERAQEAGARVICVGFVVDRQEGGREDLLRRGYQVRSLFNVEDLGLTPAERTDFERKVAAGLITAP